MNTSRWVLFTVLASACGPVVTNPAPPAHPGPRFVVTSAPSSPGSVFFEVNSAQRLVGRLELPAGFATTHPLRLAVRWSAAFDGAPGAPQTLSPRLDGRAGAQAFESPVTPPPEEFIQVLGDVPCPTGRFASSWGQLVLYVDVNENGELDLFETDPIDQVLGASAFHTDLFGLPSGDQTGIGYGESCGPTSFSFGGMPVNGVSGEVKFRLFNDARMNLTACNAADVFTSQTACGIRVVERPKVGFSAFAREKEGVLSFNSGETLEVFVDDELQGVTSGEGLSVRSEALLTGEHRLRVEGPGLLPWEATVRLPQPVVVLERPTLLTAGQSYSFFWSTQPGVKFYWFSFDAGHGRDSLQPTGGSVSYVQAKPIPVLAQTQNHFEVSAQFVDFPGSSSAQFEIPVRDSN